MLVPASANGKHNGEHDSSDETDRKKMQEAVRDLPGTKRGPVTADDVERRAGLDELAEVAEPFARVA